MEQDEMDAFEGRESSQNYAPEFQLPDRKLFLIEYPGVVNNLDRAIVTLGGQKNINKLHGEEDSSWELKVRPENIFSHPILGQAIKTRNFILKITRRVRRRKETLEEVDVTMDSTILGLVNKTVRFRAMSDFQYQPEGALVEEYYQLMQAIEKKDIAGLAAFPNIRREEQRPTLLPPPLFSSFGAPFSYKYEQTCGLNRKLAKLDRNAPSHQLSYQLLQTRYYKNFEFLTWSLTDPSVPSAPLPEFLEAGLPADLKERTKRLFEERPMWTRAGLLHSLNSPSDDDARRVFRIFAYHISKGPWRDTWARYGFDPRLDPESRRYQILGVHKSKLQIEDSNIGRTKPVPSSVGPHIFSLNTLPQYPFYQICDVKYPRIDKYVDDVAFLNPVPNPRYGWFHKAVYRRIHSIFYDKYHALLDQQRIAQSKKVGVTGAPLAWSRLNIVPLRRRVKNSDDDMSDTDIETLISRDTAVLLAPDVSSHVTPYIKPVLDPVESSGQDFVPDEFSSQLDEIRASLQNLPEISGDQENHDFYNDDLEFAQDDDENSEFEYYDGDSEMDHGNGCDPYEAQGYDMDSYDEGNASPFSDGL